MPGARVAAFCGPVVMVKCILCVRPFRARVFRRAGSVVREPVRNAGSPRTRLGSAAAVSKSNALWRELEAMLEDGAECLKDRQRPVDRRSVGEASCIWQRELPDCPTPACSENDASAHAVVASLPLIKVHHRPEHCEARGRPAKAAPHYRGNCGRTVEANPLLAPEPYRPALPVISRRGLPAFVDYFVDLRVQELGSLASNALRV
ncbi:hypothetical protein AXG93_1617s1180 [Marchantia polymorpha subsp. ruderalis]|uniref:Uncharacterized protein n=1 Tax=Marchantia polymorpha subsp. ruderalis TaxID=1480154 RepID=A0A176W7M8_MARPO|nr:hypothetical protein AXG93_1617s1180 [Marchantia polymorpha subsp. ruderalis]